MTIERFQKLALFHREFAADLLGHLARLWSRSPVKNEVCVVRSYTLCVSFMSLESSIRRLSFATSAGEADAEYRSIAAEVDRLSKDVVAEVRKQLDLHHSAPDPTTFGDLLSWEEAVLEALAGRTGSS